MALLSPGRRHRPRTVLLVSAQRYSSRNTCANSLQVPSSYRPCTATIVTKRRERLPVRARVSAPSYRRWNLRCRFRSSSDNPATCEPCELSSPLTTYRRSSDSARTENLSSCSPCTSCQVFQKKLYELYEPPDEPQAASSRRWRGAATADKVARVQNSAPWTVHVHLYRVPSSSCVLGLHLLLCGIP
ncbi:hypothetical protein Bbelb_111860 [Branchiostoma belcheri]|nr:hypothetical protein Bbelb_111800 [Branchiostoma belcheri]KAI8512083.1 hypothetical protein Bbelb_111830 [Branchiostoma belcheri]KAI8512086.1 hypothetical protein Bbelb_111860 [Branchiostoma belcheri]